MTDLDPGPAPAATSWEDYLAAARSLDLVRRDAAAAAATATYATSSARAELARTSARLERQAARLGAEAVRAGIALPNLVPSGAERAEALAAVAGGRPAVPEALRRCHELIDAAEAELDRAPPAGTGRWPPARWLVLAATATVVLVGAVLAVLLLG
jgi:hypothetical protein